SASGSRDGSSRVRTRQRRSASTSAPAVLPGSTTRNTSRVSCWEGGARHGSRASTATTATTISGTGGWSTVRRRSGRHGAGRKRSGPQRSHVAGALERQPAGRRRADVAAVPRILVRLGDVEARGAQHRARAARRDGPEPVRVPGVAAKRVVDRGLEAVDADDGPEGLALGVV